MQSCINWLRRMGLRCRACDCELTDTESTTLNEYTGEYEDMCKTCLRLSLDPVFESEVESVQEIEDEVQTVSEEIED